MEEQPVAFAIIMWSPNSWVMVLMFGVSPQPAQAPENSKSGWANWEFFMLANLFTYSLYPIFLFR